MEAGPLRHPPRRSWRLAWMVIGVVVLALSTGDKIGIDRRDEHGMTALMHAARDGDLAEAERLIRRGADVKAVVPTRDLRELVAFLGFMQQLPESDIGYTALHYAVASRSIEVVRLLVREGADVNHAGRGGETPLGLAISGSDLEAMRVLVAAGARSTAHDFGLAVSRSSPETVGFLLANGADPNVRPAATASRPGWKGTPVIIVAAIRGDPEVLRLLIEAGADVNAVDQNGWSALRSIRRTARRGSGVDYSQINALLEAAGASDEAGERADALFAAVLGDDLDGVRAALAAGADPNARDDRGVPPLIYASQRGQAGVVAALVEAGADVNVSPEHDTTPLIAAVTGGSVEVVEALLAAGARVDQADRLRQTPLELAGSWGRDEISAVLLAAGARPDDGALARAALSGNADQVRTLLSHGADPNRGQGNVLSEAARGCLNGDNLEVIRALLEAGADPRVYEEYGYTSLHRAAGLCSTEVVRLLLAHGADPNVRDGNGYTPLISAAGAGKLETVEVLIGARADVNARDIDGKSVLDYAAPHPAVVEALRRAGAR